MNLHVQSLQVDAAALEDPLALRHALYEALARRLEGEANLSDAEMDAIADTLAARLAEASPSDANH